MNSQIPPSPKLKLSAPHLWGITGETPLPPCVLVLVVGCVVVVGWATWDVRERMWSGRTMDAIRHHHRSHNHLPTRYTPTLYYTWYTSVAQPPSQDMVTLYTRHTTVVQPTPDLPTFYTRYATSQTKCLHQKTPQRFSLLTPDTPTTPCTRYFNLQHQLHQHSTGDVPLQVKVWFINVCIYLCLSEKDSFSSSAGKRELKVINSAQI